MSSRRKSAPPLNKPCGALGQAIPQIQAPSPGLDLTAGRTGRSSARKKTRAAKSRVKSSHPEKAVSKINRTAKQRGRRAHDQPSALISGEYSERDVGESRLFATALFESDPAVVHVAHGSSADMSALNWDARCSAESRRESQHTRGPLC